MDGYTLQRWERTQALATLCGVRIGLSDMISLRDKKGLGLGCFGTVDEAFAFMCGYEHSVKDEDSSAMEDGWCACPRCHGEGKDPESNPGTFEFICTLCHGKGKIKKEEKA